MFAPIPILELPETILVNVPPPIAIFLVPVVRSSRTLSPIAILNVPVVILESARASETAIFPCP